MLRTVVGLFALLSLSACSSSGDSPAVGADGGGQGGVGGAAGSAGTSGAAGSAGDAAAPSCDVHATSGAPSFTDRTTEWGLGPINGNRFMVADLDGDGFPDLITHRITSNLRDPLTNGAPENYHVLMNRPRSGGGRTFVDETLPSGYGTTRDGAAELRSAQFAVAADVDGDGDLDLFSGTNTDPTRLHSPLEPAETDRSELLLNDGHGKFALGPKLEPLASLPLPTTGATFSDVDGDGNVDLWVVAWYQFYGFSDAGTQARLLHGNGDGTFTEATGTAGLVTDDSSGFLDGTNSRPAYGTTSCDVDADGDADLLVSAYGRQWNQLYLNDGTGKFTDVGQASGYAGDANADYSDNQMFRCWCVANPGGDAKCPTPPSPQISCAGSGWSGDDALPWRNNGNTFSTACGDVTGDGVMDLYSAEIRHWWAGQSADGSELLVGAAGATPHFTRPGNAATGMSWPHVGADWNEGGISAAIVDLDNDARADVVVGATDYPDQYTLIFHQKPDGTFEEVGAAWGLHHACGNGIALADFDRDGDLDVVIGSGTARDCSKVWSRNEVHLYESDASTQGHYLSLRLTGGNGANRAAIGARVSARAGGLTQVREVNGGYGHFGMQQDQVVTFGLGACTALDGISVLWPDAAHSETSSGPVSADQLLELAR